MPAKLSKSEDFGKTLKESLIAWSRDGELALILAEPPLALAGVATVVGASGAPLKAKRGRRSLSEKAIPSWPELGVQAKPNAFLAIVLDGTADLSVGVTESMAKKAGGSHLYGLYQVRVPRKCVFLYPAYVPTSDGFSAHWAGQAEEQPDCTILWIDILPEGAILHTCHTRDRSHGLGPFRFIFGSFCAEIDAIIEELRAPPGGEVQPAISMEIAQSLLHTLLLRIWRSLAGQSYTANPSLLGQLKGSETEHYNPSEQSARSSAVERACVFIRGRLNQELSVDKIARQAFVSPAQLNRLFRAELGQSVMQHVIDQRLESAKSLLENTTLPVNVISENVGIKNTVYFSSLFRRKVGVTPLNYRITHKIQRTPIRAKKMSEKQRD